MKRQESAETTALRALGWLAGQPDLLGDFLAQSGASGAEMARRAAEPAFLASVMDFVLAEDARVIAFCDAAGLAYTAPMQARAGLPGGEATHWT